MSCSLRWPRTFSVVAPRVGVSGLVSGLASALTLGLSLGLTGCAQAPKPLYSWENFPKQQYETLLGEGADTGAQIQLLEAHAEKARAAREALPPGFRMHLGMLHLSTGNASAARQLWLAEKLAFPESSPYVDTLLKRLEGNMPGATKENPA